MIVGVLRTTKFALQNFWRNLWLSLVTVFILVLTMMSITLVGGLNVIGNAIISAVQDKVNVDFYFYDYVPEDDVLQVQKYLKSMNEVSDVVYVSREEAMQKFREEHASDPKIIASLDELDTNVLPASLVVRAHNIQGYPTLISRIENSEFKELIDRTDYTDNQKIISSIQRVTDRASQIAVGVSAIFVIISLIVVFNTIRVTIYSHREEVGIMKLVGATNWFVRAPFILESIFLGIIAAAISSALFYALVYVSNPAVSSFFNGYDFSLLTYLDARLLQFIAAEVIAAVVLTVVSSMIAMTKHLKI